MFLLRRLLRAFAGQYLVALCLWTQWIQKAKNEKMSNLIHPPAPSASFASPSTAQLSFCHASTSPPSQLPTIAASSFPAAQLPAVIASTSPPAPASGPPASTCLARLVVRLPLARSRRPIRRRAGGPSASDRWRPIVSWSSVRSQLSIHLSSA
jgi:hypothetical protein